MNSYRTVDLPLGATAAAQIEIKRSRFLAQVSRVASEQDARAFIAGVRSRHHDARHHCTAFVLGPHAAVQRSNDDGEPAGTAGRPILEVIVGRELSDVVLVVTRWFGGVLLGAGGLVRAYGDAAAAAMDVAGVRWREELALARISVPHAIAGSVEHRLRQVADVVEVGYRSDVEYLVAHRDLAMLERELAQWTAGAARLVPAGRQWRDVDSRS